MSNYRPSMDFACETSRAGRGEQLWRMTPFTYEDGLARGSRAVDVANGSGLRFTVLLDRGMDLYDAEYCGTSLAWLSAAGPVHPAYVVEQGFEPHKSWPAGLMSTCGLLQAGHPEQDGAEWHGLHGRYKGIAAENVSVEECDEPEPLLQLRGAVRECTPITGCNLLNQRTVRVPFRRAEIEMADRITNLSTHAEEIMLVYHFNFGHPLLSESTRLLLTADRCEPLGETPADGWAEYAGADSGVKDHVYLHYLKANADGHARVLLYNPDLGDGLGVELCLPIAEIPYMSQWKNLNGREYVTGLEPGSAFVLGRGHEREAGRLVSLQPGETRAFSWRLIVRTGEALQRAIGEME